MMRASRVTAAVVLAIGCVCTANAGAIARLTASLPDIGPPPQGEVQWIARSMRMNGVPMTLKTLRSQLQPQELFDHYEAQRRGREHSESRRSVRGDWQVLAIKSHRHYVTIQVRQSVEGSDGTITVTAIPATPRIATDFPRPLTTKLVSLQEYDDGGIESEYISLSSPRAVAVETQAFVYELTRDGWQARQRPAKRGAVIEAQRGAQQAFVTLQPDSAQPSITAIVALWKKS